MFSLSNKISIVTGSTSGIGKAAAIALASQGSTVVVSGRREAEGVAVVNEIKAAGGEATFIAADVTSPADVNNLFEQTKAKYGKIDIAFLNSGVYSFAALDEQTHEDLDRQIDINIKGAYYGLQQAAEHLSEGGSVIFNSSTVADVGMPTTTAYSLTKGAINTLVRTAAVELAPKKIRVNAVAPGPIWTEGIVGMMGDRETFEAHLGSQTALGRGGDAHEIASVVAFLASEGASFVTGQVLLADGGMSIK